MSFMSNIFSKGAIGALAVGAALAFSTVKAEATTVIELGTISDATVGPLNLATDSYRIDWFAGSADGTVEIDTYVDPFQSTGTGGISILLAYDEGTTDTFVPTGTWGTNTINFTQTLLGWEALLGTTFTEAGLAGSQLLTINWEGAIPDEEQFSLRISAVPLPAGGLLLLTALGGMAVVRRRRKDA